jgi:hypothetical protein
VQQAVDLHYLPPEQGDTVENGVLGAGGSCPCLALFGMSVDRVSSFVL